MLTDSYKRKKKLKGSPNVHEFGPSISNAEMFYFPKIITSTKALVNKSSFMLQSLLKPPCVHVIYRNAPITLSGHITSNKAERDEIF